MKGIGDARLLFPLVCDGTFLAAFIFIALTSVIITVIPTLPMIQFIGFGLIAPFFSVAATRSIDPKRMAVLNTLPISKDVFARTLLMATLLAGPLLVILSGVFSTILFGSHHWLLQAHLLIPFVLSLCSSAYLLLQSERIANPVPVLVGPFFTTLAVGCLLIGSGWRLEATGFSIWFHLTFPPLCLLSVLPSISASKSWWPVPTGQWNWIEEAESFEEAKSGDGHKASGGSDRGGRPVGFQNWILSALPVHPVMILFSGFVLVGIFTLPPHNSMPVYAAVVGFGCSFLFVPMSFERLFILPLRTPTRAWTGPLLYLAGAIGFSLVAWLISNSLSTHEGFGFHVRLYSMVLGWGSLLVLLRFVKKDSPWPILFVVLFTQIYNSRTLGSIGNGLDRMNPIAIFMISLLPLTLTLWVCHHQVTKGSRRKAH